MNIELDWKYLIDGGSENNSFKIWDGEKFPLFSGFDLYYRIEKGLAKIVDGKVILFNNDYGMQEHNGLKVPFKPYYLKPDENKTCYYFGDKKYDNRSKKIINYIASKNVIFDNDTKRNLKKFRNKFADRLTIIKVDKNNITNYSEYANYIFKTWKKNRMDEKKLFNPRLAKYKIAFEKGFDYYDDMDYYLFKIDNVPVAYSITLPVNNLITNFEINMTLDYLREEKLTGIGKFIYAFGTRYNKTPYWCMGYSGRKGLSSLKEEFTVYTINNYLTEFWNEEKKKEQTNKITEWFE
jgi:hypothetical protein